MLTRSVVLFFSFFLCMFIFFLFFPFHFLFVYFLRVGVDSCSYSKRWRKYSFVCLLRLPASDMYCLHLPYLYAGAPSHRSSSFSPPQKGFFHALLRHKLFAFSRRASAKLKALIGCRGQEHAPSDSQLTIKKGEKKYPRRSISGT